MAGKDGWMDAMCHTNVFGMPLCLLVMYRNLNKSHKRKVKARAAAKVSVKVGGGCQSLPLSTFEAGTDLFGDGANERHGEGMLNSLPGLPNEQRTTASDITTVYELEVKWRWGTKGIKQRERAHENVMYLPICKGGRGFRSTITPHHHHHQPPRHQKSDLVIQTLSVL
jgi:hypothetical protein